MKTLVGGKTHLTVLHATGHAGRCSRPGRAERAALALGPPANALSNNEMGA